MKKQTYDLEERLLEYSVRIIKVECSLLRVFFSFDVGRSMFDVGRSFVFEPLYETTPKWHSFFIDQTGRFSGQRLG